MSRPLVDGASFQIGPHDVRREGPLVHVTMHGNLTLVEMTAFVDVYQALIAEQGCALILMDVSGSTGMDMDARKMATTWTAAHATRIRTAVFGANSLVRTMMNMFNRAARVLAKSVPELVFFANEAAARGWLLERYDVARSTG